MNIKDRNDNHARSKVYFKDLDLIEIVYNLSWNQSSFCPTFELNFSYYLGSNLG